MKIRTTLLAAAAAFAVSDAEAARNAKPVITSASSATTPENAAGSVYFTIATDRDGDPITYYIAGGRDAADFTINATTGAVSFATPPDFEAPADFNLDNVYSVKVGARDNRGGAATRQIAIAVTDLNEAVSVRRVVSGLTQPIFATGAGDGSGRLFVAEKPGRIRIIDPLTGAGSIFLEIGATLRTDFERGLLGLAFAPDYETSGYFYVQVSSSATGNPTEIRRYRVSADPNVGDATSGDVILSFTHPEFTTAGGDHRAGWIGFGADGYLYIATGDADTPVDASNPGQDLNSPLGKILRIDVSGDDFPADASRDYRIPSSNPFAGGGGLPEIYAYGLRNPFRAAFDPLTGDLLIADVGEDLREEIDLIDAGDAGRNFGWARFEGTVVAVADETAPNATPPVLEYGHGLGPFEGNSVTGGIVNRGPVNGLKNHYIFADFVSDNIWSLPVANFVQGSTLTTSALTRQNDALVPDAGSINGIVAFGTDDAGFIYIVDIGGEIFRLENE